MTVEICKTIVATALPTIVADLHGGNGYSWVGRCVPGLFHHRIVGLKHFVLVRTCLVLARSVPSMENCPICLVRDFFLMMLSERVPYACTARTKTTPLCMYICVLGVLPRFGVCVLVCLFLPCHCQLGSALCGAAQNMTWLIGCRALQGIGGGGLIQLSVITISDIVPLKE